MNGSGGENLLAVEARAIRGEIRPRNRTHGYVGAGAHEGTLYKKEVAKLKKAIEAAQARNGSRRNGIGRP